MSKQIQIHGKNSDKYMLVDGVFWHKGMQRWRTKIRYQGKNKYLGSYKLEEDAKQAIEDFYSNAQAQS